MALSIAYFMNSLSSVVVVCGPTATGKSDAAVELALTCNGEIISCDSRQVYTGLDLGSGKITHEEMHGVPHYMLDVCPPSTTYSVAEFQKKAGEHIADILKRGKTPILCGGTGLYIDALIYNTPFPQVGENKELRKTLGALSAPELYVQLQAKDKTRAETIDPHNKVRLIRALEIVASLGSVPKITRTKKYNTTWIYKDFEDDVLKERIHKRLLARLDAGMLDEGRQLHSEGLSYERMIALGLEYKYMALFLQGALSYELFVGELEKAIWQYVKRQRTWFKKYIPS